MIDFKIKIAKEQNLPQEYVKSLMDLLEGGATVPFIARYRKEATGGMDEVQIAAVRDRIEQLQELGKRRESILKSIDNQEKLTQELKEKIEAASTLTELEDIYLPYKPKRKTNATVAREKGLEPLARIIFDQQAIDPNKKASEFINIDLGVESLDDALQGARDIIAEWVNENQNVRSAVRRLFEKEALISSKLIKGKEGEGTKYKDYFEWSEPVLKVPSHRLLAMRRGEKEMVLSLDIAPAAEMAIELIEKCVIKSYNASTKHIQEAIADSYKRLLKPSMETEFRLLSKTKADEEAIRVFSENLQQLLLAPPLGQKNILAVDPGFRTGCKVVVLDEQGKLLTNTTIYPNEPQRQTDDAGKNVKHLCDSYNIEAIAIGNGTASRETEQFIKSLGLKSDILILMVNESGASIYSASEVAREEFPHHDVTVRGAVSIGRRLMDPLAELVKIDAKSIGVGQYQHDVDQTLLKRGLDEVVSSCVNRVGVELNTASKELLSYVSGIGPQLAKGIVEHRNANGPFKDKKSLTQVSRLGDKAFEQAAGFIRIRGANNPLDRSAVHPESYHIVQKMARDVNASLTELTQNVNLRSKIDIKKYRTETIGLPTLQDIMGELDKPGRDPRDQFEVFEFMEGVNTINDLKEGMELPGIVTNVTKFGAFVDIGVHQDGLVHISHLSNSFVKDPTDVISVQQKVKVRVLEIDLDRKRIALSMKDDRPEQRSKRKKREDSGGDMSEKLKELKGLFNN
ncbi:MAG: Tex family protein [Bacteroidota bacterium]